MKTYKSLGKGAVRLTIILYYSIYCIILFYSLYYIIRYVILYYSIYYIILFYLLYYIILFIILFILYSMIICRRSRKTRRIGGRENHPWRQSPPTSRRIGASCVEQHVFSKKTYPVKRDHTDRIPLPLSAFKKFCYRTYFGKPC